MKKWIHLLLIVAGISRASSQEAGLQFDQANQAYRSGEYEKASSLYEQIAENGYESPSLFYNLGNALFKMKDIPGAILNYERARRLSPHDEDITYNLRLANLRVIDKIDPLPELFIVEWWHEFMGLYSSARWAVIAISLLWGAGICGGIVLFSRSILFRRILVLIGTVSFLSSLLSFNGMFRQLRHEASDTDAIVFVASVSVKSSPDAQSTDLFLLHEGVKVELLDTVENWKKIRLPDGKMGWIPVDGIRII